jgi:SH3-like domain-containing protein
MRKVLLFVVTVGLILGFVSIAQGKDFVVEVKSNRVNLRAGGSMVHKIIAKLETGTRLVATREVGDWYRVRIPRAVPVYLSAKYIDALDGSTGVVRATRLNIRPSPSTQYSIIGTVEKGTHVKILGRSDGWLKIQPPAGAKGWVYKKYMRRLGGVSPAEAADSAPRISAGGGKAASAPARSLLDDTQLGLLYEKGLKCWIGGKLGPAKTLFQKVLEEGKGTAFETLAASQMKVIRRLEDEQRKREEDELRRRKQNAVLEEKLREKYVEICRKFMESEAKKKPVFVAEGTYESMGWFIGRRGTHRLVCDGRVAFHLRSKTVDLYSAKYYGKKVGIVGKIVSDPSSHWKIIDVTKVVVLKK